jgi:hypothetical protein
MAGTIGRIADVYIGDSLNDVSYIKIGKVKSANPSNDVDQADSTNNDDLGHKTQEYADGQISFDVTYVKDDADAGQAAILAAVRGRTKKWISIRPLGTGSGKAQTQFRATISSNSDTAETGAVQEGSASFLSDGAPDYTAQT